MRLRSLDLTRFGHFTDRTLDFGPANGSSDFHIIYGPNEAGKTTTMEAVLRLFYGFPHREPYAFRHQRSNLRVSGCVEIEGTSKRFTRLPLRNASLLDGQGAAVPDAALTGHLGGLSEADYRALLCLDDDTLERGGEEIAQAKGDIGRLLFSASAGVADLSAGLLQVREAAEALWRPRASKTRVAAIKQALKDLEGQIRQNDVTPRAWEAFRRKVQDAQSYEGAARAERDRIRERMAAGQARQRALPLLAEIDVVAARLQGREDWPAQLGFEPDALFTMLSEDTRAQHDRQSLEARERHLTDALAEVIQTPELVGLTAALAPLTDRAEQDRAAARSLDDVQRTLGEERAALAGAVAVLGLPAGQELDGLLEPSVDLAMLEAAREQVIRARDAEARERAVLAGMAAPDEAAPAGEGVAAILARHDEGRLSTAYQAACTAMQRDDQAVREALSALAWGRACFETVPDCPHGVMRAEALEQEHVTVSAEIRALERDLADLEEKLSVQQARATHLIARDGLVSDAQAEALYRARHAAWAAHRDALTAETATTFEQALEAVDAAVRTRLANASALGELRQIEQTLAGEDARRHRQGEMLERLKAQRAALETTVTEAATAAGLAAAPLPSEWRGWVQRHDMARKAERKRDATQAAHRETLARAGCLMADLRDRVDLAAPTFEAVVARAQALAEAERAQGARVLERRETQAQHEARLVAAQAAREAAEQDWAEKLAAQCGEAVAPSVLLASLEPLRQVRRHAAACRDARDRLAAIGAAQSEFAADVAAIARRFGVAGPDHAQALFAALTEAGQGADAAAAAYGRIAAEKQRVAEDLQGIAALQGRLEAQRRLMAEGFPPGVPVETLHALYQAGLVAQAVIRDRAERARLTRLVLTELAVPDLATARDRLAGQTLALLEAESATITREAEVADEKLTQATAARRDAERDLQSVHGDATAAELSQRKATLELELEEAACDYLRLSLGHGLAEEAIRRYRETHRSGMMAVTERCFAALTRGAYVRLGTQPENGGEVLLVVDASGTAKRADELSKGTRFQLYLALRAAAYEQLGHQGIRLPFFCDDIFETFDEGRTEAACRVMEEIGQAGQAVYLTHHRHVVDIARAVCRVPPQVHRLA